MARDSFKRTASFLLLILALTAAKPLAQGEDLSILKDWVEWSDSSHMLRRHWNGIAFQLLEKRREKIRGLATASQWKSRQEEVKASLSRIVGPFPERTPLRSRVLEVVRKEGYRIEKIVFESVPNFYVTSCLFIPEAKSSPPQRPETGQAAAAGTNGVVAKMPAILNVIGHTDTAFRDPMYQQLILNLVKKGFVVLAMDPVGQGERLQYYDPAVQRSVIGGPTTEHSYFGRQCFISGSSAARYFTWDGIRAIDYLVSRPEVDARRIGVTGISGGGTQTSYISALDERVAAAAPTCFITGFQRLLESIGPQDAEQNFNAGLANGIDHADFLEVRAPKPTLVVATTRDFFSIQGTREIFAEAKKAFAVLGAEGNLAMVEDDLGHGYTIKNREAIYAFFQKHLDNPGSAAEEDVDLPGANELRVTPSGQVADSLGGETVFSLNRAEAAKRLEQLDASRGNLSDHLRRLGTEVKKISGFQEPEPLSGHVFRGRYQRQGYSVEMHVMKGEGNSILPFLLMIPDESGIAAVPQPQPTQGSDREAGARKSEAAGRHPALICLYPQGKSSGAAAGSEMEWFVRQGYAVLSPDLSGTGELGVADLYVAYLGVQIGRSIAALRAGDIIRCVKFLKSRPDIDSTAITVVAHGGTGVPLLHAALFEGS
ncbi:MAG TPA: alpha/beta hydrolase family protein, partial [Acidobacteriota bacterium]